MSLKVINYPYVPEGRVYKYVAADHPFIAEARQELLRGGCRKHATGAVAVRDGKIIARGSNAGIHVTICPRVYKGFGTGEGYRYCKEYCDQLGHAEVMVVKDAQARGVDLNGADVYLGGHWWACKNCWDTLLAAGVRDLYLAEGSELLYDEKVREPGSHERADLKVYVSGPLTRLVDPTIKAFYEGIGQLAESLGFSTHVPHLHTDPIKDPSVTPEQIFAFDSSHVKDADVIVAYVGEPSLGTGMELQMALQTKSLIVLLSEQGRPVSRLVLGNPAVIEHIQFATRAEAFDKLRTVFEKLMKTAKRKNVSAE